MGGFVKLDLSKPLLRSPLLSDTHLYDTSPILANHILIRPILANHMVKVHSRICLDKEGFLSIDMNFVNKGLLSIDPKFPIDQIKFRFDTYIKEGFCVLQDSNRKRIKLVNIH